MDYLLRSYACVRRQLRHLKSTRSNVDRSIQQIREVPPYLQALGPAAQQAPEPGPADVLIRNARLFPRTTFGDQPVSVAIREGRIAHVGDEPAGVVDGHTRVIDAQGNSVSCGLCDSHVHLMVGAEHRQGCDVEDIKDTQSLLSRLKTFACAHEDHRILFVFGLHYTDPPILPAQQARHILDEVAADKPVFVYAHDLHTGWANTKALEVAGLMRRMPPFPTLINELEIADNIERDRDGLPTGELREPPVYFIVEEALRKAYPLSLAEKRSFLKEACDDLASLGLTAVHGMGLDLPEEDIETLLLLLELEETGDLPLRVHASYSVVPDELMLEDVRRAAHVRTLIEQARQGHLKIPALHRSLFNEMHQVTRMRREEKQEPHEAQPTHDHALRSMDDYVVKDRLHEHACGVDHVAADTSPRRLDAMGKVHCKAVKIFMDGVVEKDTAYRLDHHPLEGIPSFSQRELDLVLETADRVGLQVAAHCIGNGSVNAMLNAVERARSVNAEVDRQRGQRARHRIEHIELCNAFDIPRFKAMEVIPSMQALHERQPVTLWHQKVPEIEWGTAFAWKSMLNAGANLVFGSDWPIVSCNCFDGIQRATKRTPWKPDLPDQHLTIEEALRAFSSSPAFAEYNEKVRGRIEPGMMADLVVLTENLATFKGDYRDVKIAHTISAGDCVYSNE